MTFSKTPNNQSKANFLSGAGEMTRLIREFDWSRTSVGPIDHWPQSLKTTLNTVLKSKFPMLLWWGEDLIQFYNDTYRSVLGDNGKHPAALGQKGKDSWRDTWSILKPLIDHVISQDDSIYRENQLVPIYRNGTVEEAYWTFSYSPVIDDDGAIVGVLVVTTETTGYVNTVNTTKQSEERFQNLVREATVGIIVMTGEEMKVEIVNEPFGRLIDRTTQELLGRNLFDIIPEAADPFLDILNNVRLTGIPVYLYDQPYFVYVDGEKKEGYLNLVYQPYKNSDGAVIGVMALCHDVTEQVNTRHKVEASELFAKTIIKKSEAAQAVWLGRDMVFDMANEKMLEILGRDSSVMGKPFMEVIPELKETPLLARLRNVLETGETYYQSEEMFVLMRYGVPHTGYYNYSYAVLTNPAGQNYGIICTAADVTEQVMNRQKIEQAEAKARMAIESASLGTYEIDYVTDVMLTSDRFNEIWGIKHGLTRKEIASRIHPDDIPARQRSHDESLATGNLHYEARIIWKDESEHWVRVKGKVIYGEKGEPITLLGVVQDINEQRLSAERLTELIKERTAELMQKNAALQESEERYHRMVDEVEDYAIILLSEEGVIQNWNEGAEKIKQYTAREAIGKHFSIFYLPEDRHEQLPQRLLAQAVESGRATHEGWRVRKDGSRFWGSIVITALHDKEGAAIGFSKVTRDLTARKEADDKLIEYTAELEARNRELEQFAFVASHDLQEPLRKIQTFTELVQINYDDRIAANKYFDKIQRSAQRMRDLIRATLNYSSLSREALKVEPLDLGKVLEEVKTDNELLIESRRALIHNSSLPFVHGDSIQISQVFANLISNAIKFSANVPVIEISSNLVSREEIEHPLPQLTEANYYKITFKDNGIGFEPQYEKRIFSIFQRLHGKEEYPGTGIGLALCRKIMENHHGHIAASSEPQRGASFFLYFPVLS